MRKRYLKLTKDQKERGVVFSSWIVGLDEHEVIIGKRPENFEDKPGIITEFCKDWRKAEEVIENLKDVKFFGGYYKTCVQRS